VTWSVERLVRYVQDQGFDIKGIAGNEARILDAVKSLQDLSIAPSSTFRTAIKRYLKQVRVKSAAPDGGLSGDILDRIWALLAKADADLHDAALPKPSIAIANIGIANGFAMKGTDGYAVVIDSAMLVLCNMLSKLVVAATMDASGRFHRDLDHVSSRIADDAELRHRTCDLFRAYVIECHPALTETWLPSAEILLEARGMTQVMESFLVAHELAHIRAGHMEEVRACALRGTESEALPIVSREMEQEMEADIYGAVLTLSAHGEQVDPRLVLYAISILLLAMGTIDGFVAYLEGDDDDLPDLITLGVHRREMGGSHAAALHRITIIETGVAKLFPKLDNALAKSIAQASSVWRPFACLLALYAQAIRAEGALPHSRLVTSTTC